MLERGTTSMNNSKKMDSFWGLGKSLAVLSYNTPKTVLTCFKFTLGLSAGVFIISSFFSQPSSAQVIEKALTPVTTPTCWQASLNATNSPMQSCNLALMAPLPSGLTIANSEINWEVTSQSNHKQWMLHGQLLQVALPTDTYDVTLSIGNYSEKIRLTLEENKLAVPSFKANIGVIQATSDLPADWAIYQLSNQVPSQELFKKSNVTHFNGIVPTGEYSVVARINNIIQQQHVRINRGISETLVLDMPTGKINLVATLANFPAMRLMNWKLYRLDGGRQEVASPRQHAISLEVPPGHYEAIAQLNGHERRREFTVLAGTSSSVVLAMD